MKGHKIEIGTRLWVTENSDYTYCNEVLVYTLHADSVFAVDAKGKTYHMIYENGYMFLDEHSIVSIEKNTNAYLTPLI